MMTSSKPPEKEIASYRSESTLPHGRSSVLDLEQTFHDFPLVPLLLRQSAFVDVHKQLVEVLHVVRLEWRQFRILRLCVYYSANS